MSETDYINKLKNFQIKLNKIYKVFKIDEYKDTNENYKKINNEINIINGGINKYINAYEKGENTKTPETYYNNVRSHYRNNLKYKLEEIKQQLNNSSSTNEISPMLKQGTLHEKLNPSANEEITRPNPDAPPISEVSTTPIDNFINQEEEEQQEPEPEEEEQQQQQQMLPIDNSQQIVQSPEQNHSIVNSYIDELKDNPELDIIKGVGDVIEFMANSNLTDEMTDDIIDKMLNMKDSHGNLLFNNRFQIEDLIRNRKKRRRIKYLLPKRIIRAEKPDEQKLIINPMLKRGRIASMTSAKERYYNYI